MCGGAEMDKIVVTIVDKQALFRIGVRHALSKQPDFEVFDISPHQNPIALIEANPPDVLLLDINYPSLSGLNLAQKITLCCPTTKIVMLTSNPDDNQLFLALKAQAVAYLSKEVTANQLSEIIRRVAKGEHPINESLTSRPKVAEHVLHQFQELTSRSESEAFISPLTPREIEILQYIAQGYLNKQIAAELGISEQTIKNHVTSILRKLNANARTEAVVVAIKQGLITID